jgi:integrase
MKVETATRFLTSVVDDEDCAYSTQKQALNALAFFFKRVCGVEEPVFGVKLRKTGTRVPVVLSKPETQRVFEKLEDAGERYGLPARLQYGAGLRLSELMRLRVKDVDLERGTVTVRLGKGDKDYPRFQRRSAKCMTAPPQSWRRRRRWRARGSG